MAYASDVTIHGPMIDRPCARPCPRSSMLSLALLWAPEHLPTAYGHPRHQSLVKDLCYQVTVDQLEFAARVVQNRDVRDATYLQGTDPFEPANILGTAVYNSPRLYTNTSTSPNIHCLRHNALLWDRRLNNLVDFVLICSQLLRKLSDRRSFGTILAGGFRSGRLGIPAPQTLLSEAKGECLPGLECVA